ncbi:hypothetical protein MIR68_002819 [Amoeboaphelidium protococcarum]|nr:hypothetical protein MIR68_002819 [Amoeboaphelidium protococcarum]
MVKAWYFDNFNSTDRRQPHIKLDADGNEMLLDMQQVTALSQVTHRVIRVDNGRDAFEAELNQFCAKHNYKNRDEIYVSKEKMGQLYEEKCRVFYEEHIHEDDEIRFMLEGRGYFDVRDKNDDWIRIMVEAGDLLILPAGIYHRFTLDLDDFIHVIRVFKEEPKWTPINRPLADENCFRLEYLNAVDGTVSQDWRFTTSAPLV